MLKKHLHFNIQHCNISAIIFQRSVLYGIHIINTRNILRKNYNILC